MSVTDKAEALYVPEVGKTTLFDEHMARYQKDIFWSERLWKVLVKKLGDPHKRVLLDYCCGPGLLMQMAKKLGWNVVGYEPSETARTFAWQSGLQVYQHIDEVPKVDAVIHTEVMEHVDSIQMMLSEIREKLHWGGYMAMSVPNDDNPMQGLFFGASQPWIAHPHVRYMNPLWLRREVVKAGFDVTWQGSSFPVEPLLRLPISRNLAWKLSRVWPAPPFLWRMNIGRHCLLVAKKA